MWRDLDTTRAPWTAGQSLEDFRQEQYFTREVATWKRLTRYLRALPEINHPRGLE